MSDRVYNVLFLCTGNSARSIIAEAILNRHGKGRFRAFSAGSHPKGRVHPYTIDLLRNLNFPTDQFRSKSWDEFAVPGAPKLDFVFTVCDDAANESCPLWPGQPMSAHWGVPDPAAVDGPEAVKRAAFADTCGMMTNRISVFTNLPIESLDRLSLQSLLEEIGERRKLRNPNGPEAMEHYSFSRRLVAEALGTALLVATVVGSGIMADSLTQDGATALLGNTLPTGQSWWFLSRC
jgi:protein-tyrosine-phosphatase